MMKQLTVLILDDEKKIADRVSRFLVSRKYNAKPAYHPNQAFDIMKEEGIDILISDVMMPGMSGLEFLRKVKSTFPQIEVIMISAHGNMDMVIEAMHHGAVDFIKKPFGLLDIQMAIERTSKYLHVQNLLKIAEDQNSLITRELEHSIDRNFIGSSPKIKAVLELALKAGKDMDASILITGENGTGKEIIAQIIHHASDRHKPSYCSVNCSAIPETLIESEFFGHVKGAFTDAKADKKGLFELANGGSLFLDEIGEMPLNLQAKLLRALEEKKIKRVGGHQEIEVDVRVISATNLNIEQLVEQGKFRIDLFHRINTITINIPPLRERIKDIKPLLYYFIEYFAKQKNIPIPTIAPGVIEKLESYSFPGNVRELRNMVERALILSEDNSLIASDFPVKDFTGKINPNYNLLENELFLIKKALKETNYNQKRAAVLLGVSRDALIRRMRKFELKIDKNFI
jgi:DNA-binding NtrC family response regulator